MVESNALQLDLIFHALSDTTRRAILRDIAGYEKTVGEIARPYEMTLAAVSKHLKVLEAAELVERRKRGSYQMVRLNAKSLRSAEEWLAFYEKFWTQQLDALQTYLEKGEDNGRSRRTGRR
ncbi:transcriptional regulator [Edaphobacter acidisoli]|uniref:Transcriptional regulator n=1 Tax=Edaphobacter acidisoli TaxID=2040573 RepID=A0A916W8X5_9BACT|nr:metalloregulator ArsR/SmtB family transcription factor [Edaphobacter acidisoli]GGA78672.1 transcriptional regulator [Edaphobacter acidisoli]